MSEKTREEYEQELATLAQVLIAKPTRKVPFVPCADVILSQSRLDPEIRLFVREYFSRGPYQLFNAEELERMTCSEAGESSPLSTVRPAGTCLPPSCIALGGIRGSAQHIVAPTGSIRGLFIGDLVWLFYFERMGIFQILGRLLDDYAYRGTYPTSNDTLSAVIMEAMVRQMKIGLASSVRDRATSYRRCLGWTSEAGRGLSIEGEVNTGFDKLFHKFIRVALDYYEAKRLAAAIQQTTTGGTSAATRIALKETLVLLRRNMEMFEYGRNNYNTLNGIVYTIGALDLVRTLKDQIGIPSTYDEISEYIATAYSMLVQGGGEVSGSTPNRYLLHLNCATSGRDLLLDIEVLDVNDMTAVSEWIDNEIVEERVENYRTAYREIAGSDLKKEGAQVPQRAAA